MCGFCMGSWTGYTEGKVVETTSEGIILPSNRFNLTKNDNNIGAEKLETGGKISMTIGRYKCRSSYKIVGLTNRTKENFNKLISKEGQNEKHDD